MPRKMTVCQYVVAARDVVCRRPTDDYGYDALKPECLAKLAEMDERVDGSLKLVDPGHPAEVDDADPMLRAWVSVVHHEGNTYQGVPIRVDGRVVDAAAVVVGLRAPTASAFWLTAMPTPPKTNTAPRHMPCTALPSGVTFGRSWVGQLSPNNFRQASTSPCDGFADNRFLASCSAFANPSLPLPWYEKSFFCAALAAASADAPKPREGSTGLSLAVAA